MADKNGIHEQFIPGLGYVRSYADVDSTKPTTPPIDPTTPSFNKSLIGNEINRVLEEKALGKVIHEEHVKGPSPATPIKLDTEELDEGDDEEDGGDTEMAQPTSERTDDLEDTNDDADKKMARPTSERVPKLKESDAPKSPDHKGMKTREKSAVEPYERDSRVYVHKSRVAGTIRRITQNDGELEYSVALDNGAVQRVGHGDVMLMTAEEASRR